MSSCSTHVLDAANGAPAAGMAVHLGGPRGLADHPRIGERHAGSDTSAAMSRSEQAGVPDDADVQARLADANRRYEARFDRIYLVRAAGRSADEMLAFLEERLRHDDATELDVTRGQLAEIAVLRLRALVA